MPQNNRCPAVLAAPQRTAALLTMAHRTRAAQGLQASPRGSNPALCSTYTSTCLNQTLKLHPTVPKDTRLSLQDVPCGVLAPAGSQRHLQVLQPGSTFPAPALPAPRPPNGAVLQQSRNHSSSTPPPGPEPCHNPGINTETNHSHPGTAGKWLTPAQRRHIQPCAAPPAEPTAPGAALPSLPRATTAQTAARAQP